LARATATLASIRKKLKPDASLADALAPHVKLVPPGCKSSVRAVIAVPRRLGGVPPERLRPGLLVLVQADHEAMGGDDPPDVPPTAKGDPDLDSDPGYGPGAGAGGGHGGPGAGPGHADVSEGYRPQTTACAITVRATGPDGVYRVEARPQMFSSLLGTALDGRWSEQPAGHALLTLSSTRQTGSSPTCAEPDFQHEYAELLLYHDGGFHSLVYLETLYRAIRDPYLDNRITRSASWYRVGGHPRPILVVATRKWVVKDHDSNPDNGNEEVHWTETFRFKELHLRALPRLEPIGTKTLGTLLRKPPLRRFARPRQGVAKPGASSGGGV
jgi:hypothetical protein